MHAAAESLLIVENGQLCIGQHHTIESKELEAVLEMNMLVLKVLKLENEPTWSLDVYEKIAHYLAKEECQLTEFHLRNIAMNDGNVAEIAEALVDNQSVETLTLNEAHLTSFGLVAIVNSLATHNFLLSLNLQNNDVLMQDNSDAINALSRFLKSRGCNLRSLNLMNCGIDDDVMDVLSEGLLHNYTLVQLNVGRNPLTRRGMSSLTHGLTKNPYSRVCALQIPNIPLDEMGTSHVSEIMETGRLQGLWLQANAEKLLVQNLQTHCPNLVLLAIKGTAVDVSVLCSGLSNLHHLHFLILSSCRINDTGMELIGDYLTLAHNLVYLCLADNPIGLGGVERLATVLEHNQVLAGLNLGRISLFQPETFRKDEGLQCDLGLKFLAEKMKNNRELICINVQGRLSSASKSIKEFGCPLTQTGALDRLKLCLNLTKSKVVVYGYLCKNLAARAVDFRYLFLLLHEFCGNESLAPDFYDAKLGKSRFEEEDD
eukprot:TRINITY_DN7560_c0_g1_i1.p1 TRINITY_DN7560_c0_g1~~TRINITY_DN7560_c0_g1_i1.p1  ORF type:complete len:486 (+),score=123.24 TRINITY_DN7560_c0_g1_i1:233-1690(+)